MKKFLHVRRYSDEIMRNFWFSRRKFPQLLCGKDIFAVRLFENWVGFNWIFDFGPKHTGSRFDVRDDKPTGRLQWLLHGVRIHAICTQLILYTQPPFFHFCLVRRSGENRANAIRPEKKKQAYL